MGLITGYLAILPEEKKLGYKTCMHVSWPYIYIFFLAVSWPCIATVVDWWFTRPVLDQNLYYVGMKSTTATFSSAFVNMLPAVTFVLAIIFRYKFQVMSSFTSANENMKYSVASVRSQQWGHKTDTIYLVVAQKVSALIIIFQSLMI